MESNLTTTFMACKAVLHHMIECRSGVIVNLTSERGPPSAGPDRRPTELPRRRRL